MTTIVVQPPAVDETVVQGSGLPVVIVEAQDQPPVTVVQSQTDATTVVTPPAAQPYVVINPALYIGGGGGGGGYPPVTYVVSGVSSFYRAHTFPYYPDVRLIDTTPAVVDTHVEYPDSSHVSISFPQPFTGTIVLA